MSEYQQLRSMSREIALCAPGNHADIWMRIFYTLALAGSPCWAARCAWISEMIRVEMEITPEVERMVEPVTYQEALSLGLVSSGIGGEAITTLACTLYNVEQDIGQDHVALLPVRWYRIGLTKRSAVLSKSEEGSWND